MIYVLAMTCYYSPADMVKLTFVLPDSGFYYNSLLCSLIAVNREMRNQHVQ